MADRKPNLFIVGAPKCGTTAWAQYLSSHPDIFFSPVKEPHYFSTDAPDRRAVRDEQAYLHLFDGAADSKIIAEASTSYLYSEAAASNIHAFQPSAKILIFLRDQREFLPSWHNQLLMNGTEHIVDFDAAWRMSESRSCEDIPARCRDSRLLNYKACGRFYEQIMRYLDCFPETAVYVAKYSDWRDDPRSTYLSILDFLGVADDARAEFEPVNQATRSRFDAVHRFLLDPPKFVLQAIALARRVARQPRLGIFEKLSRLNRRPGYRSELPATLKDEIRSYYQHDNERVRPHIRRPDHRS